MHPHPVGREPSLEVGLATLTAHDLDRRCYTQNTLIGAHALATADLSGPRFTYIFVEYVPCPCRPWTVCRSVRTDGQVSGTQSIVFAHVLDGRTCPHLGHT